MNALIDTNIHQTGFNIFLAIMLIMVAKDGLVWILQAIKEIYINLFFADSIKDNTIFK